MKKMILSVGVVVMFAVYAISSRFGGRDEVNVIAPNLSINQMHNSPMMQKSFKDGEYIGDVTDAYYGNLQVKTIITGGKIADVQFLQYPNDKRTSEQINQQAMPYLKQEAIMAQSSQVDIISGATQTSEAFKVSLQSALNQAI